MKPTASLYSMNITKWSASENRSRFAQISRNCSLHQMHLRDRIELRNPATDECVAEAETKLNFEEARDPVASTVRKYNEGNSCHVLTRKSHQWYNWKHCNLALINPHHLCVSCIDYKILWDKHSTPKTHHSG